MFVFLSMNKCRNFTHLSILLPVLCACMYIPTHRMNTSATYRCLFVTPKRNGREHGGICIVFKEGLLNFRVQNKIQKVCNVDFYLSFVSKIFAYLFEIPL